MNENQQGVQLIESEEDKKKKAGLSQPGSAFTSPTGAKPSPTGPVAPSGTQQARAAQAAGPTKGTGFTGVGRYLQANVGSRLGEQVAGRVAQTGQQAQTRLGQAVDQFGGQLKQQTGQRAQALDISSGALRRLAGRPAEAPGPVAEGEAPPAVDLTPSQEEIAAYQAVTGGQFQAPSGLQDIGDIRSQARLAGELAAGTRDTEGRLGLLRQVVGRGPQQYTKGQSALDALILGQSGGQLAAARRASAGLERKVGTEEMLAAERGRQFGAQSERAKAELVGGVTGLEKTVSGDISAQKSKYETDLDKLYTEIQEGISKGEISKDTAELMKNLGFDPTSFSLYGINPEELKTVFERRQAGDITLATSATAEQLQKINALRSLSGQTPVYSAEDLEKAGTTTDPLTGLSLRAEDFKTAQEQQRASVKKAGEEFVRNLPSWQTEAGSLFTHSGAGMRGQQTIRRDLQERFNRGLYDPATGKLDEKLIKDLVDFWSTRTQYEGKSGFLGTGAGRYGRVEGDAERIAALQKLLGETQKTFKIKEE